MLPIQNGLICWLDASDGKVGETLLKDRTSYGHNLVLENFQQGYGFTGKSIKVKKSGGGSTIGNALYIANGGFKTHCKSFCLCIERNNTSEPWYIFDGRGLSGQGSGANHCYNGNTGESYDKSKTRKDGILTQYNAKLETDKKVFFYFELNTAELFTLSILMRYTKNESPEGQFYSLYAYNRALTEQEILHNMEYEKNKISYVNDKNLPKIVEKLSDASNIKITGNKYGDRVQTVIDKIVEKADNVTKAINQEVVNYAHSFKVGTGNNVNVSSDVQDSFSEISVKGQTYQNLYPKLDKSNYVDIYGLYHSIKFDGDIIKITANGEYQNFFLKKEALSVKPNTTYTLVIDILKNTIVNTKSDSMLWLLDTNDNFHISYFTSCIELNKNVTIGRYKFKVNTKNNLSSANVATRCFLDMCASSGELWIKYSLLEGDHVNNSNLPSYFEGIVGVGDESKNLFNPKNATNGYVSSTGQIVDNSNDIRTNYISIKPNTPYIGQSQGNSKLNNYSWFDSAKNFIKRDSNNGSAVSPTNAKYLIYHNQYKAAGEADINKAIIQIEEGIVSTQYKPYYNGYKIDMLSTSKNLFNVEKFQESAHLLDVNSGVETVIDGRICIVLHHVLYNKKFQFMKGKFKERTSYTLTGVTSWGSSGKQTSSIKFLYTDGTESSSVGAYQAEFKKHTVISDPNKSIEAIIGYYWHGGAGYFDKHSLCLTETNAEVVYEPYTEDKLEFLLDQPLMRLPNGIYDEINNGQLIRKCGEIIINYDTPMELSGSNNQYQHITRVWIRANYIPNLRHNSKFLSTISTKLSNTNLSMQITNGFDIHFPISITGGDTLECVKNWLKNNPIKVIYELKNPVVTDLSSNRIKILKDGYLQFNTLVAPESTHIVQLNKSAQIQNTVKQLQLLDNKITVLENNYDNLMLSTMSILNDLEFDYTLK